MTATPSLLEETVEGGAGVFRGVQGLRSGEVEGLRGRVEAAGVAHVLVGDARGDGLRALETSGRVEIRALAAGVKIGPAPHTGRVRTDTFQVPTLLAAGAAGEDDGLFDVGAASARAFAARGARPRRPAARRGATIRVHVASVSVLAIVVHGS